MTEITRVAVFVDWLDHAETYDRKEAPLCSITSMGYAWRDPDYPDALRLSFHGSGEMWATETTHNIKIDAITGIWPAKRDDASAVAQMFPLKRKRRKRNGSGGTAQREGGAPAQALQ